MYVKLVCLYKCNIRIFGYIFKNGLYNFQGTGKWYEMQDLHVTDILPQMITLTEAYIQVSSEGQISEITLLWYSGIDHV